MIKKKSKDDPRADIVGQELVEGDMVAFNPPRLKGLTIGIIKSFSAKTARVEFVRHTYDNSYNDNETSVRFMDLLKVDEHVKTLFLLKHGGLVNRFRIKND